jgi:hypothetical protein
MNDQANKLDKDEEEIFIRFASDEELELAAADMALPSYTLPDAWCCP